ncbi:MULTISPECIES: DUF1641 domain-containing protein [Brevibacillus]|jgi:uncharacterized protein YjgD (DUF1641 family)|uniref:DUF1641 domain-containing protein n=1 Tax=Brevibacillus thermoruber TaxID=33942 RepID=A0A9X3TVB5_9BACL|nr:MULTISPECIES: DUF1641 domain-containing protein [Brevibacillus]MDA5110633.1 DUF1641 domain-containing protein [Brevibacillus thermoruber]UYZ11660.1 DUF1641 domain-containing protein [Brevibacillus sp. WF146]
MAKPTTKIVRPVLTEAEKQAQALEQVKQDAAQHAEGIREALKLLQELHDSGILEALKSLLEAKEKVAKIAVGQLLRPPVTNSINNAMAVAEALSEIEPDMTKKLVGSLVQGLQQAKEGLEQDSKVGLFDLVRALQDPDINRAIGFGLNLLKGMGQGLKE